MQPEPECFGSASTDPYVLSYINLMPSIWCGLSSFTISGCTQIACLRTESRAVRPSSSFCAFFVSSASSSFVSIARILRFGSLSGTVLFSSRSPVISSASSELSELRLIQSWPSLEPFCLPAVLLPDAAAAPPPVVAVSGSDGAGEVVFTCLPLVPSPAGVVLGDGFAMVLPSPTVLAGVLPFLGAADAFSDALKSNVSSDTGAARFRCRFLGVPSSISRSESALDDSRSLSEPRAFRAFIRFRLLRGVFSDLSDFSSSNKSLLNSSLSFGFASSVRVCFLGVSARSGSFVVCCSAELSPPTLSPESSACPLLSTNEPADESSVSSLPVPFGRPSALLSSSSSPDSKPFRLSSSSLVSSLLLSWFSSCCFIVSLHFCRNCSSVSTTSFSLSLDSSDCCSSGAVAVSSLPFSWFKKCSILFSSFFFFDDDDADDSFDLLAALAGPPEPAAPPAAFRHPISVLMLHSRSICMSSYSSRSASVMSFTLLLSAGLAGSLPAPAPDRLRVSSDRSSRSWRCCSPSRKSCTTPTASGMMSCTSDMMSSTPLSTPSSRFSSPSARPPSSDRFSASLLELSDSSSSSPDAALLLALPPLAKSTSDPKSSRRPFDPSVDGTSPSPSIRSEQFADSGTDRLLPSLGDAPLPSSAADAVGCSSVERFRNDFTTFSILCTVRLPPVEVTSPSRANFFESVTSFRRLCSPSSSDDTPSSASWSLGCGVMMLMVVYEWSFSSGESFSPTAVPPWFGAALALLSDCSTSSWLSYSSAEGGEISSLPMYSSSRIVSCICGSSISIFVSNSSYASCCCSSSQSSSSSFFSRSFPLLSSVSSSRIPSSSPLSLSNRSCSSRSSTYGTLNRSLRCSTSSAIRSAALPAEGSGVRPPPLRLPVVPSSRYSWSDTKR
uniref:Uncharacterized protein n=1 Tax=Anopheles melas TaxID=34690 RepID=A0A182UF82_9DIPT